MTHILVTRSNFGQRVPEAVPTPELRSWTCSRCHFVSPESLRLETATVWVLSWRKWTRLHESIFDMISVGQPCAFLVTVGSISWPGGPIWVLEDMYTFKVQEDGFRDFLNNDVEACAVESLAPLRHGKEFGP